MTLGEKIKKRREMLGMSQADLAVRIGVTQGAIGNYESGVSNPKMELLPKLFLALNTDANYLFDEPKKSDELTYHDTQIIEKYHKLDTFGKEVVDSVLDLEYRRCTTAKETAKPRTITISRSLLTASAGAGEYLNEGNYEPREFPDVPQARQADVVIPVSGKSMEPMFYDGDELYVRKQPSVEIGEIGIFYKGGEGFVKEAGEDRLISLNPDYDDIYTDGDEQIVCFGKVLGKVERSDNN
jgi:transcriptional regulator with XRE-family HTH domain